MYQLVSRLHAAYPSFPVMLLYRLGGAMPGRRKDLMDIRELLIHIRDNPHDRAVQRDTGVDRRTVQRYRRWATHHGLLTDPLPPLADLHALLATTLDLPPPPQNVSSVE